MDLAICRKDHLPQEECGEDLIVKTHIYNSPFWEKRSIVNILIDVENVLDKVEYLFIV